MQKEFGTLQESKATLLYNSLLEEYKRPFGAVVNNQNINFVFPIKDVFYVEEVRLIIRKENYCKSIVLPFAKKEGEYSYFENSLSLEEEGVCFYRFEIDAEGKTFFVGKNENGQAIIGDWLKEWQLTVTKEDFATPEWTKGGIIYHIFADRFAKKDSDITKPFGIMKKWGEEVTIMDSDGIYLANDFFGGNFEGIIEKLDYLANLGVSIIYLSPIFLSHSNHRYDTADYMQIDPLLGDEKTFSKLINKAKEKNINIMLDGVFNHTGADSVYFNRFNHFDNLGAYNSKDSEYYDWFTFQNHPDEYTCWWGMTCVPTIARDSEKFVNFITGKGGVIEKWTKIGVKGWRLDVVDELSDDFVVKIRNSVKSYDKNCLLLGEVWEDASTKESYGEKRKYFLGDELDSVMNYPYKNATLNYVLSGNTVDFYREVMQITENYPKNVLDNCMSMVDSHDTKRAINLLSETHINNENRYEKVKYRLSENEYNLGKNRLKLASAIQFFLPGMPSIYYGDEVGMQGFEDPLNRRSFPWDNIDNDLLSHYQKLGMLRANNRLDFATKMDLKIVGSLLQITRGQFSLITNVGETIDLGKTYKCIYSGKEKSVLNNNDFVIIQNS